MEKTEVLKAFKPHLFFDDQLAHVTNAASHVPCAHVPFGIANRMQPGASIATPIRRRPPDKAVTKEREKDNALPA
jgi:5'-nucleotidase